MNISSKIQKLRWQNNLTQEKFAEMLGVTRQAVQKWETNQCAPDFEKICKISTKFNISLDELVLDRDNRSKEILAQIVPDFSKMHFWNNYSTQLDIEYIQSIDEGKDVEKYKDLITAISKLDISISKAKFADTLFDLIYNAPQRADYKYVEPLDYFEIKELSSNEIPKLNSFSNDKDKIKGAWIGRICGCLLGKNIEGIRRDELIGVLKDTGNYPMTRYILSSDLTNEISEKYSYKIWKPFCNDNIDVAPSDDDTNYTVMSSEIIKNHGRDFTPYDVADAWINNQPETAYCTAERVAFKNFVDGYMPPFSAVYKNPYREWIGAQIRADYYGYINPCKPEAAAEMAFRDASISHVKNGIYGAMFVAAMIACAAGTDNIIDIINGGLSQIPSSSRLFEAVKITLKMYDENKTQSECVDYITNRFDDKVGHDWCHTISNACIVVFALLYGEGDYGKSICLAVQTGFDTDCNGATVGSIIGMRNGFKKIPSVWYENINNQLRVSLCNKCIFNIDDLVETTLEHIKL